MAAVGHAGARTEETPSSPIRVLVVDDHPTLRAGLVGVFAAEGDIETVGEARSAEEAVRAARTLEPDLVLLDLVMPGGSGLDALPSLVRESPGSAVLVFTMLDDLEYVRAAFAAGAQGYLLKEAGPEELVVAVREVVAGGRYLDPALGARLAERETPASEGPDAASARRLSPRELEVLRLVALGHTNQEAGLILGTSPRTIESHRLRIARKLGVRGRTGLVRYALACGLLEGEAAGADAGAQARPPAERP